MKRFNLLTAALALLAVVSCNKAGGDTSDDVSISGQVKSYSWKAFQNGDVGNGPEVIPHAGTFDVAFDNFGVGYRFLAYGFTGSRNAHKMTGCTPDNHSQQDVYTYTLNSKGQVTKIRRGTPESGFYQDVDIKYYD